MWSLRIWSLRIWKWFEMLVDVREGRVEGVYRSRYHLLSLGMAILDSRRLGVEVE